MSLYLYNLTSCLSTAILWISSSSSWQSSTCQPTRPAKSMHYNNTNHQKSLHGFSQYSVKTHTSNSNKISSPQTAFSAAEWQTQIPPPPFGWTDGGTVSSVITITLRWSQKVTVTGGFEFDLWPYRSLVRGPSDSEFLVQGSWLCL